MPLKVAKSVQISAVIATLNRIPYLMNTLRDCLKQRGINKEIIVVDQTPLRNWNRRHLEWVRKNCRYYHRAQKGVSAARNFGIRQAKGDVVLFLDDDVAFGKSLFQIHWESHKDPNVGGVLGLILEKGDKSRKAVFRKWSKRLEAKPLHHKEKKEIFWAPSGNTSYKKEALLKTKGFDEKFKVTCEDSDLSLQIRRANWRLLYIKKAEIFHHAAQQGGLEQRNYKIEETVKWQKLQDNAYYYFKNQELFGKIRVAYQIWITIRMYLINKQLMILRKHYLLKFLQNWCRGYKKAKKLGNQRNPSAK